MGGGPSQRRGARGGALVVSVTREQEEAWRLSQDGLSHAQIAEKVGSTKEAIRNRIRRFRASGQGRLESVGYSFESGARTPQEAWRAGQGEFERTVGEALEKNWQTIKRPKGPFVLFHITDPHVDDPGSALNLIEQDVRDSRELDATICHGGDLANNWPMMGRLAKKWAEQECTKSDALLRARYYIDMLSPDVWVDGNHDEMNPYFVDLIREWLPEKTITDYWCVNFEIKAGSRPIKVRLSHKFDKGKSWFHRTHGQLRELLEGEEADLLLDGHLHSDGTIDHTLPERGISMVGVASAGYKFADKFARRISRGSLPKIRGRAHWIVCDPEAEYDENLCTPFKSPRQAEAMLSGLQNLRAV